MNTSTNKSIEMLEAAKFDQFTSREAVFSQVREIIENELDYTIVASDETRPWGGFFCLPDNEADRFVTEFFPGLSAKEARLGNDELGLSPKILIVLPGQRLSWQYHHRRAERWRFLSEGGYYQSEDDEMGEIVKAGTGEIVQFQCGGRHRLCGADSSYTLVAEIWQHTDMNQPSDEADIVRVADDYGR